MEEELEAHFRTLCQNYENILDDTIDLTQPIDERVGLGLFKIDEACTLSDKVRQDAQISKGRILKILSSNCEELEKIFMRLNHIDVCRKVKLLKYRLLRSFLLCRVSSLRCMT
jgi:hypothetical protein